MNGGRVHLIGVGGAGMSGIARILLARGIPVSGSDAHDSDVLASLRARGAAVHVGHAAQHVDGAATVVVSAAVRETNPELAAARAAGATVLQRAEALAWLTEGHRVVAVAGTHGKTTTTSMLAVALQAAGADPSFAVGGDLQQGGVNAHHGSGELFVLEADESDGSFLVYQPCAAIVTNVEADHLDHHGTEAAYEQAFRDFAASVSGFLVLCADDPGAAALAASVDAGPAVLTYGVSPQADLQLAGLVAEGPGSRYQAVLRGVPLGEVRIPVAGEHLARNSAAALLTAVELGLPAGEVIAGLAGYAGVRRRMELKGAAGGVRVYDDYAHHPTELQVQLVAARHLAGTGRVIAVFQPHLYSRTQLMAAEFGQALGLADEVVVLDVYGAREEPVPGVSGELVAQAVPLPPQQVRFAAAAAEVPEAVAALCREGDLVITLGAGDITQLGPQILTALGAR